MVASSEQGLQHRYGTLPLKTLEISSTSLNLPCYRGVSSSSTVLVVGAPADCGSQNVLQATCMSCRTASSTR